MTIHRASRWIREHDIKNDVHILTDSQSAIEAQKGSVIISKVTLKCHNSLKEAAEKADIQLIWLPGYKKYSSKLQIG